MTANCKEFNFIAEDNTQSQNKQYGGKRTNIYQGYESKIFSLTDTDGQGGINFINGMNHKQRSVSNNQDNIFQISGPLSHLQDHGVAGNEEVKFYPRVEDSGNPGKSSNNFALFNGSSILKDANIKHANIHLTHTLFQNTDGNHIVKKKGDNILLDGTDIEADGNANKMTENNVYTFIDENVKINGTAGTKCVIGPNIYIGKDTQIEKDNKLSNIYIGPKCKLNTKWHYQPENPSDLIEDKFKGFFQGSFKFVHVAFEDNDFVLKEVSDKQDLANKIKELLGFNNSDDTKYIERNAGNKNIWIGKNIEISKSNCFNYKKINKSTKLPLTNLLVLNKDNSNKFNIDNDEYKFYHNCIIELNYYKEIFDQADPNEFYNAIFKNYDTKRLFIFAKPEDLGNFKLGNNLPDTDTSKTSKSSTSKTSKAPSSTGKKSSSKKMSALEALIDEAIVSGSDKIGPEIKMSTGRMRASKGSTSSRSESDTRTKVLTSEEISEQIKDITNDIQGLIKDFKGSEGIFSGGGSNYVSNMQAVDDSLNSIKFLESKIQESKVGKDKDASSIGLFKFITSESRKALKDKQLTDSTRKLYEELEADKKDLEPYYSSKFLLKSGDIDKLLVQIDKVNDTNKWSQDKVISEIKQKIILADKRQSDECIRKIISAYNKTERDHGKEIKYFVNICQLVLDLEVNSKHNNSYLHSKIIELKKTYWKDPALCHHARKPTETKKGQGKGQNGDGNTGQQKGKGEKKGDNTGKNKGGNNGKRKKKK